MTRHRGKAPDITTLSVGSMASNCHIISDSNSGVCAVIDPGDDAEFIIDTLIRRAIRPVYIAATHGHFDHIMAAFALQAAFAIPFYIHAEDEFLVRRMRDTAIHFTGVPAVDPPPKINGYITDASSSLDLSPACRISVIETPGHTPGSVSFVVANAGVVCTGDTLFAGGTVGSTDHEYSSRLQLKKSVHTLLALPKYTRILPGHGQESTIEAERSCYGV